MWKFNIINTFQAHFWIVSIRNFFTYFSISLFCRMHGGFFREFLCRCKGENRSSLECNAWKTVRGLKKSSIFANRWQYLKAFELITQKLLFTFFPLFFNQSYDDLCLLFVINYLSLNTQKLISIDTLCRIYIVDDTTPNPKKNTYRYEKKSMYRKNWLYFKLSIISIHWMIKWIIKKSLPKQVSECHQFFRWNHKNFFFRVWLWWTFIWFYCTGTMESWSHIKKCLWK